MAHRLACPIALLSCLGLLAGVSAAQPVTPEALRARAAALAADPSVIRHYSFTEVTDPAAPVASLTGAPAELRPGEVQAALAGASIEIIDGPWPGTHAVRLDTGYYSADPFPVTGKAFTVAAWLRTNGLGAVRGDSVPQGGTLLSLGGGYWDGWRLTLLYPNGTLGFELGRPQPASSFGVGSQPMTDGAWHYVVASWEGKEVLIYVDGLPVGQGAYDGEFAAPGGGFRIGFAGFGWGSAKLDVADVTVYGRALSPGEVVAGSCVGAEVDASTRARFDEAETAGASGSQEQALSALAAVSADTSQPPTVRAVAATRRVGMLAAWGRLGEAVGDLDALVAEGVPEGLRSMALAPICQIALGASDVSTAVLERLVAEAEGLSPSDAAKLRFALAKRYRAEGKAEEASALVKEAFLMPGLSVSDRLDGMLQVGHAAMLAGDLEAAGQAFSAIAGMKDAPSYFVSYAGLCQAEAYARAGDYGAAGSVLTRVKGAPTTPWNHRWEAEDRLRELPRLQQGLPPRDPAWSRVSLPESPEPKTRLYVAPDGSDTWPGTENQPLATIAGARDAIRQARAGGADLGPIEVVVGEGAYPMADTIAFEARDSGTAEAPITYRAAAKGKAVLTGGVRLTGFEPVTDQATLARLPEEGRGRVLRIDLRAAGLTDLGVVSARGYGHKAVPQMELFCDGKPLTPARWPNEGFLTTGEVTAKTPEGLATFRADAERMKRWAGAHDAFVYGFWRWLWADEYLPIAAADPTAGTLSLGAPTSVGDLLAGMPYFVLNLLEEIDQPGEWYLDRESGVLYVYPTADPAQSDYRLSVFARPFVSMAEASHITLEGLTFEYGQSDGCLIEGGEGCLLAGCTLRQLGGTGVSIAGGSGHGVFGCDIHTLGRGGTRVSGGDRKTLTPSGHFVENCHIYDFSRIDRTYTPAAQVEGVAVRVAHNRIHGSPGHAMRVEGNDHVIELNEVFDVVRETDDQGGLDMWYNPTYRGVSIRYNFWHDIGNDRECGQSGVRLDDAISGIHIYGNVFLRCSRAQFGAVQIHGGKENVVENNVMAECRYGVSFSPWGEARWAEMLTRPEMIAKTTTEVDITQPPYSTAYPDLARLAERPDVNRILRNLVVDCGGFLTRDQGIQETMDNTVKLGDPGFVDAAKLDYALKPDAEILRAGGFRPIPFEEIGQYEHPLRAGEAGE